jgi:hypothetical protein
MAPEDKARAEIGAMPAASGSSVQPNLQRATRLRQSILQKAFTGAL